MREDIIVAILRDAFERNRCEHERRRRVIWFVVLVAAALIGGVIAIAWS
jgi:hypothetical protein